MYTFRLFRLLVCALQLTPFGQEHEFEAVQYHFLYAFLVQSLGTLSFVLSFKGMLCASSSADGSNVALMALRAVELGSNPLLLPAPVPLDAAVCQNLSFTPFGCEVACRAAEHVAIVVDEQAVPLVAIAREAGRVVDAVVSHVET